MIPAAICDLPPDAPSLVLEWLPYGPWGCTNWNLLQVIPTNWHQKILKFCRTWWKIFLLACVLIIHAVLPEFIQTFNLSFWISDIIKCDINVPWSVNNKSFVITTKNRKNSWKCFLYGGCTRTVKKKNWSQMTKNAQREGLVNCCNL